MPKVVPWGSHSNGTTSKASGPVLRISPFEKMDKGGFEVDMDSTKGKSSFSKGGGSKRNACPLAAHPAQS